MMSSYFLIVIIPLMFLWPIWGSWIFTPCTPCTPSASTTTTTITTFKTTSIDTLIITATTYPAVTLTVTSREEYRLRRQRQNQEFTEKLNRRKQAQQQEREAREAAMLWEQEMRNSWSLWFMDYCYYPVAYLLVACVVLCMAINWDVVGEEFARFQEEERKRERLEDQLKCL